jgi:Fur family ferric uptake transcriptional regulator
MKRNEDKFKEHLKNKGLKLTKKRLSVLDGVMASDGHFDADELCEVVQKRNKGSRATVYRVIPLLIDAGLITKTIGRGGRVSYERISSSKRHDHMICINCGAVIEFSDPHIDALIDSVCRKHAFKSIESNLGITGYCRSCAKKKLKS